MCGRVHVGRVSGRERVRECVSVCGRERVGRVCGRGHVSVCEGARGAHERGRVRVVAPRATPPPDRSGRGTAGAGDGAAPPGSEARGRRPQRTRRIGCSSAAVGQSAAQKPRCCGFPGDPLRGAHAHPVVRLAPRSGRALQATSSLGPAHRSRGVCGP